MTNDEIGAAKIWHYERNGEKKGPVSAEQIDALIDAGALTAHSLVWSEALENWTPLHKTALKPLLGDGAVPPPDLPPPAPETLAKPEAVAANIKEPAPDPRPVTSTTGSSDPAMAAAMMGQAAPEHAPHRAKAITRPFLDNGGLALFIRMVFLAQAAFSAFVGLAILRADGADRKARAYNAFLTDDVILIIYALVAICGVVAFLFFVNRAAHNAVTLSGTPLEITPGWAAGWYFVPIANLFMPWKSMTEIWERSGDVETANATVSVWWFLFVGSIVFEAVADSFVVGGSYLFGSYTGTMNTFGVASLVSAAAAYLAAALVKDLKDLQNKEADRFSIPR